MREVARGQQGQVCVLSLPNCHEARCAGPAPARFRPNVGLIPSVCRHGISCSWLRHGSAGKQLTSRNGDYQVSFDQRHQLQAKCFDDWKPVGMLRLRL